MEPNIRMRGPAPCPIARIAGKHRQQIELIAPGPAPLQKLLAAGRDAGILRAGTPSPLRRSVAPSLPLPFSQLPIHCFLDSADKLFGRGS